MFRFPAKNGKAAGGTVGDARWETSNPPLIDVLHDGLCLDLQKTSTLSFRLSPPPNDILSVSHTVSGQLVLVLASFADIPPLVMRGVALPVFTQAAVNAIGVAKPFAKSCHGVSPV
jgi:hypothetical protein